MTQTSATRKGNEAQISDVLAAVSRRASHEVRNALNAVAVNIEVVRSRLARPDADPRELQPFAERASLESDAAASLANGLADLTRLLARAAPAQGEAKIKKTADSTIVALPLCSSDDNEVTHDLKALAARLGVSVSLDSSTVIFTVRD
jgi:signal transduction histidine kinase